MGRRDKTENNQFTDAQNIFPLNPAGNVHLRRLAAKIKSLIKSYS